MLALSFQCVIGRFRAEQEFCALTFPAMFFTRFVPEVGDFTFLLKFTKHCIDSTIRNYMYIRSVAHLHEHGVHVHVHISSEVLLIYNMMQLHVHISSSCSHPSASWRTGMSYARTTLTRSLTSTSCRLCAVTLLRGFRFGLSGRDGCSISEIFGKT